MIKKNKFKRKSIGIVVFILLLSLFTVVLSQPILSRSTRKLIEEFNLAEKEDFFFNTNSDDVTIPSTDRGLRYYETIHYLDLDLALINNINQNCYFSNLPFYNMCEIDSTVYQVKVNYNSEYILYDIYKGNTNKQVKFIKGESVTSITRTFSTSGELNTTSYNEYEYNGHLWSYIIGENNELYMYEYVNTEFGRLFSYDNRGENTHNTNYFDFERQVNHFVQFFPNFEGVGYVTFRFTNEHNNVEALLSINKPIAPSYKIERVHWNLLNIDGYESVDDLDITYINGMPFYTKDIDLNSSSNEDDVLNLNLRGFSSNYFTKQMIDIELDYIMDNFELWYFEYGITFDTSERTSYYVPGSELDEFTVNYNYLED